MNTLTRILCCPLIVACKLWLMAVFAACYIYAVGCWLRAKVLK